MDKRYEKFGSAVSSPSEICGCVFDYVVVAVADREISKEIILELKDMGIPDKKIVTI